MHGVYFECAGIPHQFYMSILIVAFGMLVLYILSTFLTICWLICPCWGRLARYIRGQRVRIVVAGTCSPGTSGSWGRLAKYNWELQVRVMVAAWIGDQICQAKYLQCYYLGFFILYM